MYKTLLRTLSALSIVTITASAGFAQSTSATDCDAPWNQNHEDCTVSTKIWLDDFASPINSIGATNGADNGFVEFGAKGFKNDNNQFIIPGNPKRGKLNLKADVVRNGKTVKKTIGGVLFYRDLHMASSSYFYYAGIKSGTNLGRPLTDALAGASWTKDWTGGKFKAVGGRDYYNVDEDDFTLNVIFNGGTGTMSALVQQAGQAHYRIAGEFDSKGVITGTVTYGLFDISRSKTTPHSDVGRIDGTLSGLIGDQGAVGVFVSDTNRDSNSNSYGIYGFAGGFVVNSHFTAAEADLLRRCAEDPFDSGCSDEKYDARKIARIEHCVTDNNWVSDNDCFSALIATGSTTGDRVSCISNPFQTACKDANADYADQYVTARADRVAFCVDSTNSGSEACREVDVVAGVCGVNPFGAVCVDSEDSTTHNDRRVELMKNCNDDNMDNNAGCPAIRYIIDACQANPFGANCGFDAFKAARKTFTGYCLGENPNILCTDDIRDEVRKRPNAAAWVNTVTTRAENPLVLGDGAGTISSESQFLKNIKSAQTNENNIEIYIKPSYYSNSGTTYRSLNLNKDTFNGTALGGDAEDGVAYFQGRPTGQYDYPSSGNKWYAGIFSTTDLGAPLNDEKGTASWVGIFGVGNYSDFVKDFVLEVNFDTQSIEAFMYPPNVYSSGYHLKGDYEDNGVISGTVTRDKFTDNNRYKPRYLGDSVSTLIGLIGKEGAVGAFAGGNSYSDAGGGFVARPADLVVNENTNKNAASFLNETCEEDPFHEFCYLSNHRKTRLDDCITGNNVLNDNCKKAREIHSCIRYPFDEQCKTTFTYHNDTMDKPYYELARAKRSAFCNETANVADDFCTGAEQVALCSYDPFNAICSNAIYDNARKAVCKAGSSHEDCAATYKPSSNVTAISWLAGLYKDRGVIPQTEPDIIRQQSQFLQGTENGLDNGDVTIYSFSGFSGGLQFLNLNAAIFDGLELGRDKNNEDRDAAAADGVAFFAGDGRNKYAGILSGTDLGEPIAETSGTAKWYGQFQVWGYKTDFTLDITFGAGDRAGSVGKVEAFVHSYGIHYYLLKGDFDSNGVISGTVFDANFANHDRIASYIASTPVLTGLIGAEGAVGVFTTDRDYGGFVASSKSAADAFDPNIKALDWVRSFGNTPVLPDSLPYNRGEFEFEQTRFLQGGETDLYTLNISNFVRPNPLTLADVKTGGESADGVGYMSGDHSENYDWRTNVYSGAIIKSHVAGILSDTNLGAALPTVPAGADGNPITTTWKGRLGLIANNIEVAPRDIDLTVDFINKKVSYSDALNGAHFVDLSANWESGVGYDGVLKGKITYNAGAELALDDTENSKGTVRGIIGKDGAVGAFISDEGSATPYAGGFVAAPVVSYANWVNSFDMPLLSSPTLTTTTLIPTLKNQFLKDGGTDLSIDDFKDIKPGNLNLKDTTSGDTSLGGQDTDGVDFSMGTRKAGTEINKKFFYAEILSGTNLGQPITDNSLDGSWLGIFESINHTGDARTVDFMLNVSFGNAGNKAGSINAVISGIRNEYNPFKIIGMFDANGVISGDIYHSGYLFSFPNHPDGPGTLTGLIGSGGAVGAFISTATGDDGYVGGFVAAPHVTETSIGYMDWVNSFDTPLLATPSIPDNPKNRFLKDGGTDLSTDDFQDNSIADIVTGNLNLATAAYDGTLLDVNGSAADGVAFSKGTPKGKSIRRFYAEILSGTNLGQPITDGTKDGIWKGSLGFISADGNAHTVDLDLNVSFGSTTPNVAGDINATIDPILERGNPFILTGTFNNRGVIEGTTSDLANKNPNGTLTGLIGQQGAVGAFISGAVGVYSGGFVAVPPSE